MGRVVERNDTQTGISTFEYDTKPNGIGLLSHNELGDVRNDYYYTYDQKLESQTTTIEGEEYETAIRV